MGPGSRGCTVKGRFGQVPHTPHTSSTDNFKMANFINNKDFWSEFINLYRQLPEVWKVKSDVYKNRNKKNVAYEKLIETLKEIEPSADREMVRKKINVLRTVYRRELKKVVASYRSGTGTENLYEPSLWYFKELDFLRDQESQLPGTSTMDEPQETENEGRDSSRDDGNPEANAAEEENPDTSQEIEMPEAATGRRAPKRKGTTEESQTRNELLRMACQHLRASNNEVDILAKSWALELVKMSPEQQIHAKKAISDILYEGRFGTLHRNSVTINEPNSRLLSYGYSPHTSNSSLSQSYPPSPVQITTLENRPQHSSQYVYPSHSNNTKTHYSPAPVQIGRPEDPYPDPDFI
ncbi:uncharacterized protein [Onthophagus taurus]|uniref:uncharacterized protein n=1 Tax=Onthophagus taurus TaxID=166361 RepID=UPI0039BDBBD7